MRLGQLSRKLNLTNKDVVAFLASKEIIIKNHPNVKVIEEYEALLFEEFGFEEEEIQEETVVDITTSETEELSSEKEIIDEPKLIAEEELVEAEKVASIAVETAPEEGGLAEPETENEPIEEVQEKLVIAEAHSEEVTEEIYTGTVSDLEEGETVNLIKAPKVELPGLKVVGKIELPKPKVIEPEESKEEAEVVEEKGEEEKSDVRIIRHSSKNARPRLTPEQMQEKRLRRKKSEERRKKASAEKKEREEKEKARIIRESHYKAKLKNEQAKIAAKKKPVAKKKAKKTETPKTQQPKSVLGKFWKWLNS